MHRGGLEHYPVLSSSSRASLSLQAYSSLKAASCCVLKLFFCLRYSSMYESSVKIGFTYFYRERRDAYKDIQNLIWNIELLWAGFFNWFSWTDSKRLPQHYKHMVLYFLCIWDVYLAGMKNPVHTLCERTLLFSQTCWMRVGWLLPISYRSARTRSYTYSR